MANVTVPNYGLLQGLAEGANSFLNAYQTTKNIQHQQKMQELLSGVTHDENGNLVNTPEKQQQIQAQGLLAQAHARENTPGNDLSKATSDFYKSQGYSSPEGLSFNEQKGLVEPMAVAKTKGLFNPLAEVKGQQLDFSKHKTAVDAVINDKSTQGYLNGVQSMNNALTEFKNNPSPQSFHTLQSVARQNVGTSNKSGVNERAAQYATDTGIKKDEVLQLLTGNMQDVNLSSPQMVQAIMKVYDGELGLKRQQAAEQIDKKAKAFSSVYKKPNMADYKQDFDNSVQAQKDQFGLIDDSKTGLNKASSDYAAKHPGDLAAPAAHPQDSAAVQWAKANPTDPRSAAILKANGM